MIINPMIEYGEGWKQIYSLTTHKLGESVSWRPAGSSPESFSAETHPGTSRLVHFTNGAANYHQFARTLVETLLLFREVKAPSAGDTKKSLFSLLSTREGESLRYAFGSRRCLSAGRRIPDKQAPLAWKSKMSPGGWWDGGERWTQQGQPRAMCVAAMHPWCSSFVMQSCASPYATFCVWLSYRQW